MKKLFVLAAVGIACMVEPPTCPAPAFMKLGDIKGEASETDHKDWVIIQSMSQPLFQSGGSVDFGDIVLTKELDKSSPKLAEAIANGTNIPEATIVFTRSVGETQEPYLQYKLTDVQITSYSFMSDPETEALRREHTLDSFSLNFEEIKLRYGGIRQTVILYDENGIETERFTVGLPTRLGGVVPPEDEVPPGETSVDRMTISATEAEAVEQESGPDVAG